MGFHNNDSHGGSVSSMGIGEVERKRERERKRGSRGVVVLLKVACLIASNIW